MFIEPMSGGCRQHRPSLRLNQILRKEGSRDSAPFGFVLLLDGGNERLVEALAAEFPSSGGRSWHLNHAAHPVGTEA